MIKNIKIVLLIWIFFYFSINSQNSTNVFEKTFNSLGLLSMDFNYMIENDILMDITLYNPDKTKFLELSNEDFAVKFKNQKITFPNDFETNKKFTSLLEKDGIKIYEFLPNDAVNFECKSITKDYYEVYTNKEKNITKLIKKDKQRVKFIPWEKVILSYIVRFDYKKNPLRKTPDDNSEKITNYNYNNENFKAKEIKGEWIKIQNVNIMYKQYKPTQKITGWIRWCHNEKVNVKFFENESFFIQYDEK